MYGALSDSHARSHSIGAGYGSGRRTTAKVESEGAEAMLRLKILRRRLPEPEPLAWMNDTLQWGARAQPGKHGLTMRDLNVGIYGEVPESSSDMSRRPRGAFPITGIPRTDLYALSAKVDLWADNAVDLYEEAIQRRWMGHLEMAWDEITPQPYEYELAMRQLCTELAQQASIETDLIGQWLHKMNYAYHEVKTFLASEIFDTGRHYTMLPPPRPPQRRQPGPGKRRPVQPPHDGDPPRLDGSRRCSCTWCAGP